MLRSLSKPVKQSQRLVLRRSCACGGMLGSAGECEDCRRGRTLAAVQRATNHAGAVNAVPPIVHEVLRSPGLPLDNTVRTFMEPRFRHDFGRVRVHTDGKAAASARAVNALAYTVGQDVVFGQGHYSPATASGTHLLAHELAHVVQQSGIAPNLQPQSFVATHDDASEAEAEHAAAAVANHRQPAIVQRVTGSSLQCHKDDKVVYSGGQSGSLMAIQAGKLIYVASAISGHPGHGENEPGVGPIPSGVYTLHPGTTRPTVASMEGGVCGARGIASGYQEITSTDSSPCSGAHYCNVPCPTAAEPARTCFTPQDCWGPKRIKIEGRKAVVTPSGKRAVRDGFYIHGGNPKDAVSSGCIKSLDNGIFPAIRKLTGVKGAVPLCVGSSCNAAVASAVGAVLADFAGAFGL